MKSQEDSVVIGIGFTENVKVTSLASSIKGYRNYDIHVLSVDKHIRLAMEQSKNIDDEGVRYAIYVDRVKVSDGMSAQHLVTQMQNDPGNTEIIGSVLKALSAHLQLGY